MADMMEMSDLISRKWLIECVGEGWIKFDTEKDKNKFIHLVRDTAPSARQWIPVTERLPDNDDKVLCCTITAKGMRNVIIGYYAGRWCCGMNSNVIAWQPLPEPYKDGD